MRYFDARVEQEKYEVAYKTYVSDLLFYQGQGMTINKRFSDYVSSQSRSAKLQKQKTGEQIAVDVIKHAGLTIIEEEEK